MATTGNKKRKDAALGRSVLVVGSAVIDTVTLVAPEDVERVSTRNLGAAFLLIEEGRKVAAEAIERYVGGGGCNGAVCFARRGWSTALTAKTGRDAGAEAVRAHLAAEGVDASALVTSDEEPTGSAVLIASHERNAAMFVSRGANAAMRSSDFDDALFEGRDAVYIAPLSGRSADCFPQIVEQGRWADAFVAANPGVRQLQSRGEAFFSAIGNIALIALNRQEAAALGPSLVDRDLVDRGGRLDPDAAARVEAPRLLRSGLRFNGQEIGLLAFCAALRGLGAVWIALTDGPGGAYLAGPGAEGGTDVHYCPAQSADAASTAGAGDAYCATLASELALGVAPPVAMRRAAANAASVVAEVSTTAGLLDAETLSERAEAAPEPMLIATLPR